MRVFGHPLHAVLVAFPLGLLTLGLMFAFVAACEKV